MIPITFQDLRGSALDNDITLAAKLGNRTVRQVSYLPMLERTTTTSGVDIDAAGALVIGVIVDITAASGTGGLHIRYAPKSPSGSYTPLNLGNARTNTGLLIATIGPYTSSSSPSTVHNSISSLIYPVFRLSIVHLDATAYTYSVHYYVL